MLKLVELPVETRDEEIEKILASWLELAQEGKLAAVAIVAIKTDGHTMHELSNGYPVRDTLGALEILKHEVLRSMVSADPT